MVRNNEVQNVGIFYSEIKPSQYIGTSLLNILNKDYNWVCDQYMANYL